jgi:hypothetical protein
MTAAARTVEVVTRWVPIDGLAPLPCECGHGHSPRSVNGRAEPMAPYWGWCDEADCGCTALRRRPPEEATR